MKKITAVFLTAVTVLALTACGGRRESGPAGTDSAKETVRIGAVGPLTGDHANYGISVRQGAEQAVREINAKGGIAGKQIELSFQDSQGNAEGAVNAYGKLLDWGMEIFLGCVLSGEMATVCAAAKDDDILLLTPTASSDSILSANDRAFRVCFNDGWQGVVAANYVKDHALADRVAVLYQSDYDYSAGLYESFRKGCEENGITIAEVQTFTESGRSDLSEQIGRLLAADVKLIFLPLYAGQACDFLTQATGRFGDDVYFFGADGLDGILEKAAGDVSIADNVLMLTPFAADNHDANVQAFVKGYRDACGAVPDQFAADAYDAVYILKAAMEKAGTSSGAAMAKAMTALEVQGVTGSMRWSADGNTQKNAMAIIYKDGAGSLFGQ